MLVAVAVAVVVEVVVVTEMWRKRCQGYPPGIEMSAKG